MEEELKPCPICNNGNIDTDEMDLLGTGECCMHAICHECGASAPVDKWNDRAESEEVAEIKMEDKRSFFSGLAVALQSVAFFDESTVAEEIVGGLGGEKMEFYEYLKSEGGVDLNTYQYLIKNNTSDILSTLTKIECVCGCDITQEVMSSSDGQFDCDCGADISWKERPNQEVEQ